MKTITSTWRARTCRTLLVVLALLLVPLGARALNGSGESSSPYLIGTAKDMKDFADIVNGTNGQTRNVAACARLTADIALSGTWTPMGADASGRRYTGIFDGQGHKITGLSISATSASQGLFGTIDGATIQNFSLAGTVSSNSDNVGSVVGYAKGASTIKDIVSTVNITMTAAKSHLGGIAGNIESGTSVLGCTYSGTLNAGSSTDSNGGIVGFANANCSGTIKYCFFDGTLKTTGSNPQMGGILGYTNDTSNNFGGVQNCYSCGTLTYAGTSNSYANAIIGRIRAKSHTTINNTFLSGIAERACNTDCDEKVDVTSNFAINISVKSNYTDYTAVNQKYVYPTSTTPTQLQVETTVTVAAACDFTKWTDGSKVKTRTLPLTADINITAQYTLKTYTIKVAANNDEYGTVSGGGTFAYDSKVSIQATPNLIGYKFVKWSDGSTEKVRSVVVKGNATYTAEFERVKFTLTVESSNEEYGTVTGGGTFYYKEKAPLKATPKPHCHFVQWSDGCEDLEHETEVLNNSTFVGTFDRDLHTIKVVVEGGGEIVKQLGRAYYGTTHVIEVRAKSGWEFIGWSDGVKTLAREITVTGDATYTARFKHDPFVITVVSDNEEFGRVEGGGTIEYNATTTIIAIPNEHYKFTKWSDGNTNAERQITVTEAKEYRAYFAPMTYKFKVDSEDLYKGYIKNNFFLVYEYGTVLEIEAVPRSGYTFYSWSDGNTENPRVVKVEGDAHYIAVFEGVKQVQAMLKDSVLTFFYDGFEHNEDGYFLVSPNYPTQLYYTRRNEVKHAVFGPSIAEARMGSCKCLFAGLNKLESISGWEYLNTSETISFESMFEGCSMLKKLDLSTLDTQRAENMDYMIYNCTALDTLVLGNFDMTDIRDTKYMFDNTRPKTLILKSIPNLDNKNFKEMAREAEVLYELDDNSVVTWNWECYLPTPSSEPTYTRTVTSEWGTLSVPFAIENGEGYELFTCTDNSLWGRMRIQKVDELSAGTPAFIHVNPALLKEGPFELKIKAKDNAVDIIPGSYEHSQFLLNGSYSVKDVIAENPSYSVGIMVFNGGRFWNATDNAGDKNVYCLPFHAYMVMLSPNAPQNLYYSLDCSVAKVNEFASRLSENNWTRFPALQYDRNMDLEMSIGDLTYLIEHLGETEMAIGSDDAPVPTNFTIGKESYFGFCGE